MQEVLKIEIVQDDNQYDPKFSKSSPNLAKMKKTTMEIVTEEEEKKMFK